MKQMKFMERKKKKGVSMHSMVVLTADSTGDKTVNKKEYNIANEDLRTCTPSTVFCISANENSIPVIQVQDLVVNSDFCLSHVDI